MTRPTFDDYVAARDAARRAAARRRVTWRRVSNLTGGGWSGYGAGGRLVFVRAAAGGYDYGRVDGTVRIVAGTASTVALAKRAAADLLHEAAG